MSTHCCVAEVGSAGLIHKCYKHCLCGGNRPGAVELVSSLLCLTVFKDKPALPMSETYRTMCLVSCFLSFVHVNCLRKIPAPWLCMVWASKAFQVDEVHFNFQVVHQSISSAATPGVP